MRRRFVSISASALLMAVSPSARAAVPTCDVSASACVVFTRSTATSVEYITCDVRSRINYIDPANGTPNAVVGWAAETTCMYFGSRPGTTVVGLSIDGDVYACEAAELHMLDMVGNCDDFGSNWNHDIGSNHLLLRPVNGYNDTCFDCSPAIIEVEALHTITFPPGFVPFGYGSGCFPSQANPASSTQCPFPAMWV